MTLTPLPCVDCITMCICRSFYKDLHERNELGFNLIRINMSKRCSIFENWLIDNDSYYDTNSKYHNFFLGYSNE